MTSEVATAQLLAGARQLSLPLDEAAAASLLRFAGLLLHWNRRVNLVSRETGLEALVERHLLDSIALARLVPERGHLVDIGAGAGFPGLPLHILGGSRTTLIEPSGRRCAFLRAALRGLGLEDLAVRHAREEELAPGSDLPVADTVVSRATFAPVEWLAVGRRWLAPGAALLVMTSREDTEALTREAASLGLALVASDVFTLPRSGARRENLLFRSLP